MRVMLISANVASTPYPVFPLGAAMVAAALRQAGHEVHHFDYLQQQRSAEALAQAVRSWKPELVGISIRNIDNVNLLHEQRYIDAVRDIVQTLRRESPAKIVLGGSAFSIMPERILDEVGADFGVVGEGEQAMVDFVAGAGRGEYPAERCIRVAPGLSGSQIPSAAYAPDIMAFYLQNGAIASVQTKRGCTHRCAYCTYPLLEGSAIRRRNPADVVADIRTLADSHGAKYIFFIDSVFNDDSLAYLDVIAAMEKAGLAVPWTGFFKPGGGLNDSVVERMKRTGLKAVELGTDAASDTTLAALGKDFRFQDVAACHDLFMRHGVAAAHFLMFGGPGETPDTVMEGIRNLEQLDKAVVFAFMGIRILPNTPLQRLAIQEGIVNEQTDLLTPTYYLSPGVERKWLEETLTREFSRHRNWIFPPDALDSTLAFLHKMGYSGSLWDLLGPSRKRARQTKPSSPVSAGHE